MNIEYITLRWVLFWWNQDQYSNHTVLMFIAYAYVFHLFIWLYENNNNTSVEFFMAMLNTVFEKKKKYYVSEWICRICGFAVQRIHALQFAYHPSVISMPFLKACGVFLCHYQKGKEFLVRNCICSDAHSCYEA